MTDEIRVSENSRGEVVIPNPFDNVIEENVYDDDDGKLVGIKRTYPDVKIEFPQNENAADEPEE